MRTTLTIRADTALRDALEQRARTQGKTLSQLIREILEAAVAERALETRVGHLRGRLVLREQATEPWRESLRRHNWRS